MYIVTGATGNTGSVVANRLLDAGKKVRVLVRSADKASALARRGAEIVVGELNDQAALETAFRDAEGVYFLSPPDIGARSFIAERKELTGRIVQSLKRAGAEHVVLLSSIGAHLPAGTGPILSVHNAEQQLREAGIPSTFVRATYFVENWASSLAVAKKDGVLPSFLPENLAVPMVATPDIGAVAARALLDGSRGVRVIELAGPAEASPADVAKAASDILGRPVKVAEAPLAAVVPAFTSFGFSENVASLFKDMYEGLTSGKIGWDGKGERVRGTTSLTDAIRPFL